MKNHHHFPIRPDDGYDPEHETNLHWHTRPEPRPVVGQMAGRALGVLVLAAIGGLVLSGAAALIITIWKAVLS